MKTLVIGMGNTIRGDDAAGILAVRALQTEMAADGRRHVDFIEFEESNINLLELFHDYDKVVVVDTVASGTGAGGELRKLSRADLAVNGGAYSTHQFGLPRVLALADELDYHLPEDISLYTISIRPEDEFCETVSDVMRHSIRELVHAVKYDLARSG